MRLTDWQLPPFAERTLAKKPEYVDLISAATRQSWRNSGVRMRAPSPELEVDKPRSRLSTWPPARWAEWRLELLKPWKKRNDPRA